MEMINIALRTEYSFKQTFGRLDNIIKLDNGTGIIGVADINGTHSHVAFEYACQDKKVKCLFGVRLMVVDDDDLNTRGKYGPWYTFIAKNKNGIQELYELVRTAYDKFYYKAQLAHSDMLTVSNDVFVLATSPKSTDRLDYMALAANTPGTLGLVDFPMVAFQENKYINAWDKGIYQAMCGARRHGDGFRYLFDDNTYPGHVLNTSEWRWYWRHLPEHIQLSAIEATHEIADSCTVTLPKAPMVKYKGKGNLRELCLKGAVKRDIKLEGEYLERFEYEMGLIDTKNYEDYFLIVADMIRFAKQSMLVGPSRGSSAGSLVCYLSGITEIDPIKHKLLFERFIDLNREDLPDIDIDFPDEKRNSVIKYVMRKYGKANVCNIANINRFRAKSTINEFAMALSIPKFRVDAVKDAIVDRSGGDARAGMAAEDTLKTTEIGKEFIADFPNMIHCLELEEHAKHTGVHAAGVIVCNEPITHFGSFNARDNSIHMDKKQAERQNLLKIDALGLKTLSILEDACEAIGMNPQDLYTMPLNDQAALDTLNSMKLCGIFQFEGHAMRMLCEQMGVETFDDIVALTAIARPGPLHSGGAARFIKRRTGEEDTEYMCDHPAYIESTQDTFGIIVYQEQLMNLCRHCGNMSWEDVSEIRKAASKTLGKEFFNKYRDKFLTGAKENGIKEKTAIEMWENMMTFGSWGMNLSHSVSYGYISYWCAWVKAHHPLEFAVANLNHNSDPNKVIKLLREMKETEDIDYIPFDADESIIKWSIHEGKLLGGLVGLHGVGEKKAIEILRARHGHRPFSPSFVRIMMEGTTPWDSLYPCRDLYGDMYENPRLYGLATKPSFINDIQNEGTYTAIGLVLLKDVRDLNEYNEVMKRGGKVYEDNTMFLRLIIQDDTGQCMARVGRYEFSSLGGMNLADQIVDNKTWVVVRGEVREGTRWINVKQIYNLTLDEAGVFKDGT